MKEDIVIFHGLGCNGNSVWIPWLAEKLRNKGHKVWTPSLSNPDQPKAEQWIKEAENIINETENNLILIGHSLGGSLILHLLGREGSWQKRLKHAYIFGAPSFTRPYTPDFWNKDMNWKEITKHSNKLTAVWSKDDDRVPEEHIKMIQENTDAQIEITNGYGHFRNLKNHWLDKVI